MKKFKVELWVNTIGETPEAKVTKIVAALDRDEAIALAKHLVGTENPEVNVSAIDTWFTEESY